MTKPPSDINGLHPRILAHLGDAVYELHVREGGIEQGFSQLEDLHDYTTKRVSGEFQARLLRQIQDQLTEPEQDWVRRGRNLPTTSRKRSDHSTHRQASGFEALIGALHLSDPPRLQELWTWLAPYLTDPDQLDPAPKNA